MTPARAVALFGGGVLALVACQDQLAHLFGAYAYNVHQDCLDAPAVIDVVAGPPTTCLELRCWVAPDGNAYVTDAACDAPPDYKNETDADAGPCVEALALYARLDAGNADAGNPVCPAPADGGAGGGNGS